jgi:hypothetical protein
MDSAGRSFTEPAGLLPSSLPSTTLPRAAFSCAPMRCSATSGVLPNRFFNSRVIHAPLLCHNLRLHKLPARVVKLVDAGDSKSPAARRAGSIPAPGTTAPRRRRRLKGDHHQLREHALAHDRGSPLKGLEHSLRQGTGGRPGWTKRCRGAPWKNRPDGSCRSFHGVWPPGCPAGLQVRGCTPRCRGGPGNRMVSGLTGNAKPNPIVQRSG